MKLEDIFPHEHTMANKLWNENTSSKKKWDKMYGVEVKLNNSICNQTKKNKLGHNLKTQNVMQLKNSICEGKKLRILIVTKPKN